MAQEKGAVMEEFLVSSQPYAAFVSQEQLVKKYGKESPGYNEDSWQWLYRFPNGLGASVVQLHFKPWNSGAGVPQHEGAMEVMLIRWKDGHWKTVQNSNRCVREADLEGYLGMIRDIPPEEVERLEK